MGTRRWHQGHHNCRAYCKVGSVLQYVAVCCSVLQCAAVCCSVLQCITMCCSVLQCVAVCCSMLQCVAVCCSVFLPSYDSPIQHPHTTSQPCTLTRLANCCAQYDTPTPSTLTQLPTSTPLHYLATLHLTTGCHLLCAI